MTSERRIANAVSGKTARACDCCIRKRARWYCPADDAFLCQVCDGSVHLANPLARRHERVRLKTASLKRSDNLPSWQRGLTRKPRTPRHGKSGHQVSKSEESNGLNPLPIVPQLGMDETTSSQDNETEDQLLYRVPIFDPFVTELCSPTTTSSCTPPLEVDQGLCTIKSQVIKSPLDEYIPSDMDLEEFAADVETLLGKGLDDEPYGIEQLGLLNCVDTSTPNENDLNTPLDLISKFPVKDENDHGGENDEVAFREPFELSFDYDDHHQDQFPSTCEDQEDQKLGLLESTVGSGAGDHERELKEEGVMKRRKILLKLDYEAITTAWSTQGSPWISGQRPDITPDDCWPHCMGNCGKEMHHPLYVEHQLGAIGGHGVVGDGGREARVSRYREKRRTRLFAKKIRYEVRKLNAEKRPRMKGSGSNKRVSTEPPAAQMTIFYGGQVLVFNDLPADKAKEVMDLASSYEPSQKKRKLETPTTNLAVPSSVPMPNTSSIRCPNPTQIVNGVPNCGQKVIPATVALPAAATATDLPQTRKASLHRFLEKRKDRLVGKAPQGADVNGGAPSKPVDGKSWLGLGSLPLFQAQQQQL